MLERRGRLRRALPAANLVTLVAAVTVLWWRTQALEDTVRSLAATIEALQVEVAVLQAEIHQLQR